MERMMRYACMMFLWLAVVLSSAWAQEIKRVAILEVVDREGAINDGVKLMVRTYLTEAVANTPGYEAYDRTGVESIKEEQNFQRTGMVDEKQIRELGRIAGAAYILVAEVAQLDANHLFINAKILNVETGKLERTKGVQTSREPNALQENCARLAESLFNLSASGNASVPSSGGSTWSSGRDFTETVNGVSFRMVYVQGGTFTMGATSEQGSDAYDSEKPAHRVTLSDYYIGECEVTQGLWQAVMGTTVEQQRDKANTSWPLFGVGSNYPMYYVNWDDAREFCAKLSRLTGRTYVLPTEAQWEYAARGGNKSKGYKYSGSNYIDNVAWYGNYNGVTQKYESGGNSGDMTHPVKQKQANELGIYDMSGNVWEWCQDWKGDYSSYSQTDPTGPSSGSCPRGPWRQYWHQREVLPGVVSGVLRTGLLR